MHSQKLLQGLPDHNHNVLLKSRQSRSEVLVFHQYSKGWWMSNPHTSFLNKNCPRGTEEQERISAELRVALFFRVLTEMRDTRMAAY